jgi:predicted site-specific integrase-resolvase
MNEKLSMRHVSKLLGVSLSTLRRWEKTGKLIPERTLGNHRRYSYNSVSSFRNLKTEQENKEKITIGYCRISSSDQKDDLNRQIKYVADFCCAKGYTFKIIQDLGSGLNYNKKGLKELINLILSNGVDRIVITYKDRLLRYGFEIIKQICDFHNVQIEIINQTENLSYEEELTRDVLSIITVFSSKLYGSRSHKTKNIIKTNKELLINK